MSKKIESIEGIGPSYAEKLSQAKIKTTSHLLQQGATRAGRLQLAQQTGVDEQRILKWVNMADLFRIKGVASQYAELLEAAGVDTVKELRTRNVENLAQKMVEVNAEKKLVRQVPSVKHVNDWVAQAKQLDPMVTY